MKVHRIVSDTEVASWRNAWLTAGAMLGIVLALIALPLIDRVFPAPLSIQPPQILEQGPARTVIRVPTRRGDADVLCTVTIDHARRTYAVVC